MNEDLISLSKGLIEHKSVTPDSADAVSFVARELKKIGFACEEVIFSGDGSYDVNNLYAYIGNQDGPNLCFSGHVDVVPPGDLSIWKIDPFKPEIIDGMLYGRGACDMKCSVAAFIIAIKEYIAEYGVPTNCKISMMITGDEEADSINGTKKLLKYIYDRGEKITYCIVGEPTSLDYFGDKIKIGRRGSFHCKIKCLGQQGHVAYHDKAHNAIDDLVSILKKLNDVKIDEGSDYFPPSNLEVTNIIISNEAVNVIPGEAEARCNIRFSDKQTEDSLKTLIYEVCRSITENFELKTRTSADVFLTEPGYLSGALQEAIKSVANVDAVIDTGGGTSDARFIKDYCEVVEFGLMNTTAHKIDECISVDDLHNLKDIYKLCIRKFCNDT